MPSLRAKLRAFPGVRPLSRTVRKMTVNYPKTAETLKMSHIYAQWWYYSVELLPGVITRGQYEDTFPFLPRTILRNCRLGNMDCLDLGSMEGVIPILMARSGARRVLATDAFDHCREKIAALQHYYGVSFEYQNVGLMYDLSKKLKRSFDLINCSGLLYHVFSPLMVLAGLRSLVKRNGLMIVSTNVVHSADYLMEFNSEGRWQDEANTFWHMSVPLLDYMLRYLKLAPIDCIYLPHENIQSHVRYMSDKPSGYISIACRAVDEPVVTSADSWMNKSARESWEYRGLIDWKRAAGNPVSRIEYDGNLERKCLRSDTGSMDLCRAINEITPVRMGGDATHVLRLGDRS
jgi:2-polyprenyl-3-methyl-5-hydroxy-6-metoxy-1,4-benzoquinol methylase